MPTTGGMGFALTVVVAYPMASFIRVLTMTTALFAPATTRAQPAVESISGDGIDALLVIHVEMDGGSEVAELMRQDALAALRGAELEGELLGGIPLEVIISPDVEQPGAYGVVFVHYGKRVDAWSCACSGDELRARLRVGVVQAWNTIAVVEEASISPMPTPPLEAEPASAPPPRVSYGPGFGMWLTGLGAMALGGGAVLSGAVILSIDGADGIEPRPVQLGLMGGGAVLTAIGIPLVVVGLRRMSQPLLSLAPPRRGRGLVLTLGARF